VSGGSIKTLLLRVIALFALENHYAEPRRMDRQLAEKPRWKKS
jgi:hypothetical protein